MVALGQPAVAAKGRGDRLEQWLKGRRRHGMRPHVPGTTSVHLTGGWGGGGQGMGAPRPSAVRSESNRTQTITAKPPAGN